MAIAAALNNQNIWMDELADHKRLNAAQDCISLTVINPNHHLRQLTYDQEIYLLIKRNSILIFTLTAFCFVVLNPLVAADLTLNDGSPNQEVDSCEACRLVVSSFEKGMDDTSRGKHEGGDTSWEEKNLKSYSDSEVRLVEIQENLCHDVKMGKAQCLSLAEDSESDIESWWFKSKSKNVRLFDYLCISKLKRCCPKGKFGPNCQACPSDCNQHGTCDGDGTRTGSGKCQCHIGYSSEFCEDCSEDHFRVATSDHFTCLKCDPACKNCYGPGHTNCTECRTGYHKLGSNACTDIDECVADFVQNGVGTLCKGNKYCVNTDGSYTCDDCNMACSGCFGPGHYSCIKCAPGYRRDDDDICRNERVLDELDGWNSDDKLGKGNPFARFIFYAGVLFVSWMMLRSNLFVMYTFLCGFIIALSISEFNLLEEVRDNPEISSKK